MNKTVGILTFHWADNYGAVLQSYALQEFIRVHLNDPVLIIDFKTKEFIEKNSLFKYIKHYRHPIKKIKAVIRTLLFYRELKERQKKFALFRVQNLNLTPFYYTDVYSFLNSCPYFDYFITGSDQVFNLKHKAWKVYYLDFKKDKSKKIAYAPSFGISSFDRSMCLKIKNPLLDFDCLSCREEDGASFLSALLGKNIPCVLDPTFLLGDNDWSRIMISPKGKEKYIFVYDLAGGYSLISIAQKIKKVTKLHIICCTNSIMNNYFDCEIHYELGPKEFLGYIKNAEYVVTDSFHGTVLSLNLGVKVISYIAQPKVSGRIISIMKQLDLMSQVIYNSKDFNFQDIIFKVYKDELAILISKSKKFLADSFREH